MKKRKAFEIRSLFENGRVPLILAPMAGVTDRAMRVLCIGYGADLVTSEMVSAKAVHFNDKKTETLAAITDGERPMALQIFGSDPEIMADSALELWEKYAPEIIDINMGCPVPKVTKNGDGSALMRDPALAGRIVNAVARAVPCPVTVKFRAGWDDGSKNAPEFARIMEANGAAMLCVHGRTKSQMYAPPVDLEIIRETVRAVSVPEMLRRTGCAGLAIARGACGNPWIFASVRAALDGREWDEPTAHMRIETARRHFQALITEKGEYTGVRESRKQLGWYLKGMRGAPRARMEINSCESADRILTILDEMEEANT